MQHQRAQPGHFRPGRRYDVLAQATVFVRSTPWPAMPGQACCSCRPCVVAFSVDAASGHGYLFSREESKRTLLCHETKHGERDEKARGAPQHVSKDTIFEETFELRSHENKQSPDKPGSPGHPRLVFFCSVFVHLLLHEVTADRAMGGGRRDERFDWGRLPSQARARVSLLLE